MYKNMINQFLKSYKYKNYKNMAFISSYLYSVTAEFQILLPISLYYNKEYTRALFFLSRMNTYTSKFYEYLCYKKIREYKKALNCLRKVVNEEVEEDTINIDIIVINKNDKEYFYNDIGLLQTQLYDREEAIRIFKMSYAIFPLIDSIENLISEDELTAKSTIEHKRLMTKSAGETNYKSLGNPERTCGKQKVNEPLSGGLCDIRQVITHILHSKNQSINKDVIESYTNYTPGIGSYVLATYAKDLFDMGHIEESKKYFYLLRSKDPKYIHNIDYFSTVLWHSSDITELGILCKTLTIDSPHHPNTWKALGNFYNHKNDYVRSMLCLKRSMYICSDYYTLNLLGFESVHKNEYLEALEYFKKSMLMLKNNYKSRYGCALVYEKMEKKESAEYYYKHCMHNNQLKVMGIKFYIKNSDMDTALKIYKEAMKFSTSDINKLVKMTVEGKGHYDSVQEFLVLEFVEILSRLNLVDFAKNVLNIVEYRGDTYYKKRELVYEKKNNIV